MITIVERIAVDGEKRVRSRGKRTGDWLELVGRALVFCDIGGAALVRGALDVGVGVASETPVIDVDVHASLFD